jgi:hypothetical protein
MRTWGSGPREVKCVEKGEEVAASEDRSIRVRLYPDGSVRLTLVRGTRYAVRQMFFNEKGGNILMMPVGSTGTAFSRRGR